jgi:hypothetical protein
VSPNYSTPYRQPTLLNARLHVTNQDSCLAFPIDNLDGLRPGRREFFKTRVNNNANANLKDAVSVTFWVLTAITMKSAMF